MSLKEYIVTLHKHEDLDSFYEDMETPGGNLYIPDRAVDVANRRPISRNTHYWLTAEEAVQIKNDPRVWDVSLTPEELGLVSVPGWTDTDGYYSKDIVTTVNDKNWGLLRGFDRDHVSGWGSDGATKTRTATLNSKLNGLNVEYVNGAYTVDRNSPEFAVNPDGSGGTRYFYVNWGQYGFIDNPYEQPNITNTREGSHETQCMSIVFGNTQGWARKARYTEDRVHTGSMADALISWHTSKPINPDTGFKNPTIISESSGHNFGVIPNFILSINYRGTTINGPFTTSTDFSQYKLWLNDSGETLYGQPNGRVVFSRYIPAQWVDYEDFVNAGIIVVGIAHNWRAYHDVPGGLDWDNTISIVGDRLNSSYIPDLVTNSIYTIDELLAAFPSATYSENFIFYSTKNQRVHRQIDSPNGRNFVELSASDIATLYPNTVTTMYTNRGLNHSAPGVIQVGALMDLAANTPSPRSGRGPRVDIWAPSRTTTTSHYAGVSPDETGLGYEGGVQTNPASQGYLPFIKNTRDPRNSNYYIVKTTDGTSFSAPQVAGVIGLWAELKPDLTPAEALTLLQTYGDSTGVVSTSDNYGDPTSLAGATALALGFSPPTFSITANKSSLKPTDVITYTISTTNVPTGSTLYLVESGTSVAGDFVDGLTQVAITTTGNTTTVSRTLSGTFTGSKTSILQIKTGGYNGTVQATNSSIAMAGATGTKLNRYGSTVVNYLTPPTALGQATAAEVSRAGHQLLRATQKTHPWREAGLVESQTISRDISYSNDGRYVDLIIADNGTWAGHTEFINRNVTNAKNPTNYIGGNVLPGNGYCDLLDIVLDAPYYIDPDWFNADSTNRLMTRWDGTRVPVEQVARNWWRASTNRSAKFASMGNVYVSDFYTRQSVYGSNTERPYLNGTHGTQCASQAYGRTLGWAFNANKWVLNNIGANSCGYENGFTLQKLFHQFKPINPVFGTKDPTLSSNSWGFRATPSDQGFGIYRGTAYQYTMDSNKPHFMRYVGDAGDGGRMKGEMIANSITVAAKEMIDAGVITLVAAGNSTQQLVKSDHPNYNNYWTTDPIIPLVQTVHSAFGYFYYNTTNRRGFPQQAGKYTSNGQIVYPVIQVGALDDQYVTGLEAKVNYSDMGNDIDCYAPGDGTWAASASSAGNVRYDFSYPDAQLVSFDTRFSGTSSACPTAAGIIATKLATNRTWTWQDVKSWLSNNVGVLDSAVFYNPPETTAGDGIGYADLNNPQGSALRVIWDAPLTTSNPLEAVLVSASLTFTVGQTAVNKRPVVAQDGSGTITYAISPALPSGLTFNTSNGFILGTASASLASTSFTVTATDSVGSSSKTFTLSIVDFSITVTGNKTFTEDETITPFTLASITGGVSPFAYYLPSTIPQYLFWNGGTNVMSGVAKEIGTKTLDLRVVDANGVEKTGSFTITINAAGPAPIYDFDATISDSTFTAGANRTSNEETVTVENTGNTPITINNITVSSSGGVTPTFDYTNWGTPTPNTILPSLTKSFAIKFIGATAGSFNNTISFSGSNGTSDVINITNNILTQTYDISPNKLSVNEGGSVIFNIATTNYGNGTLYWKNVGTTRVEDFSSPFRDTGIGTVLTGDVAVTSNIGSFTLTLSNDKISEGNETIIIELYADQALTQLIDTSDTVTVVDTSTDEIPSYSISANSEFVDEGDTVLFYIESTVIQEGETYYWTNEGTTKAADFTDNLNSGQVYINSYTNLLYRTLSNDYESESKETIVIALRFGSVTGPILATSIPVYVRDTSATPTATYSLTSDKISVNEGDTVNFEVATTNLMDRTVLYWTTRGNVDLEDFKDNKLSGSFKIVNNQGAFRRTLKNDIKTELPETFIIELRKRSIYGPIVDELSVNIVDTSITPPVDPEPTPEVIPGGGTKLGKLNARVPIIIRLP